jgi:ABC-type multidrug transport system fused ATPase/permease subunit
MTTIIKLWAILSLLSLVWAREVLDKSTGVKCWFMKTGKRESYIELGVEKLKSSNPKVKIPIFILHYPDLAHITLLPNKEQYLTIYKDKKEAWRYVYDDNGDTPEEDRATFIVQYDEGFKDKTWNKPIVAGDPPLHFPIESDGYYCVYTAQPLEVSSFEIPITFKQSHGNLDYLNYLIYSNLMYILALSSFVFGYLLNYLLKFKIGLDFGNLNQLSIISRITVFYVLLPFIVLLIVTWIVDSLQNNFVSTASNDAIFQLITKLGLAAFIIYQISINYMILLFAMGFGTIYYFQGNSRHFRELPTKLNQTSRLLLVANCVVAIVAVIFYPQYVDPAQSYQSQNSTMPPAIVVVLGGFNFVFFVLTFIYYFKTKKIISKFPPISNSVTNSTELNAKIVKAFKRSFLVIFILPMLVGIVSALIYGVNVVKSMGQYSQLPTDDPNGDGISIINSVILEFVFLKSPIILMVWSQWLSVLLSVIGMYAIWIKGNADLLDINEPEDTFVSPTVRDFVISDEENDDEDQTPAEYDANEGVSEGSGNSETVTKPNDSKIDVETTTTDSPPEYTKSNDV